jgi:hypothetical protein
MVRRPSSYAGIAMSRFEYKVVPAPSKGTKAKGVKTAEARFSLSVETTLNEMAASGWDYVRAELLPSEERSGLTGSTTNWRNVLIFRRAIETASEAAIAATPAVSEHIEPSPAVRPVPPTSAPEPEVDLPTLSADQTPPEATSAPSLVADRSAPEEPRS